MDLNTFLENHKFGVTPTGEFKKLHYYDFEKKFINHITNYKFSIINKARQMHITNLLAHYTAWFLINNKNEKENEIIYINKNNKMSEHFIILVKNILIENNSTIKDRMGRFDIKLNNNKLNVFSSNTIPLRGHSLRNVKDVFLEEFSFWDDSENFLKMLMPNLGEATKITILSTPNGKKNYFTKLVKKSKKNKTNYKILELPYIMNPEWTDDKVANLKKVIGKRRFKQEMEIKFIRQ